MVGCNMLVGQCSRWHFEHVHFMCHINIKQMNIFTIILFPIKYIVIVLRVGPLQQ